MEKRVLTGWLLIAIGLTPVLTFLLFSRWEYIAWFSNHAFIIMGVALLLRSPFWLFAELCLGAVSESAWTLDFLWRVFTGEHLWGLTEYMFKNGGFDWLHLYSLQHILFVPAAVYALYLLGGPVKRAWLGSFAHGLVIIGVSYNLATELNLNCVFYACAFDMPFYAITWPLLQAAMSLGVYAIVWCAWPRAGRTRAG